MVEALDSRLGGEGTPWRKTLLRLGFRCWRAPCPQQDAAGGTLKSPYLVFAVSFLHCSDLRCLVPTKLEGTLSHC